MILKHLQHALTEAVPLSKQLGIRVSDYEGERLVLDAELGPNINRHNTAFAGSQAAIGIAAGWTYVFAKGQEHRLEAEIVAGEVTVSYLRPVPGDFQAVASFDFDGELHVIEACLNSGRNAKVEIPVNILCDGKLCSKLQCQFVFVAPKNAPKDQGDSSPD